MNTLIKYAFFIIILNGALPLLQLQAQQLQVSENHRYLEKADGTPFFWLGDTAWELFHRLDREEATRYLENRSEKGFTVIQAVVLAELDGLHTPNPYDHIPLKNNDPTRPNEAYFEHVDFIVNKAEELGMYIGMLPTWGDKFNRKWGEGPEVFTPENAEEYGRFLGERYSDKPVIWILGGDRTPDNQEDLDIIDAMAAGIHEGDQGNHLMTYHPQGGRNSAEWFHDREWLDFNMFQSGHGQVNNPNFRMNMDNYERSPVKPTLDGEPCYEDHPVAWDPEQGWFHAFDTRQAAYWGMLAGAMGHTYGNHNIWQMWEEGHTPISAARTPWFEAMDYPGAFQMEYFRDLFESRPFHEMEPAQSLISADILNNSTPARAAKARDNDFLVVYIPHGQKIIVNLNIFKGKDINAYWYNPRLGTNIRIKDFQPDGDHEFDPPADRERGNDWVLVVEDAAEEFPEPGK